MDNIFVIIGIIVGVLFILAIAVVFLLPGRKKGIEAVIFERNGTFEFRKCESVAGIAGYTEGGFDINAAAAMKFSYGGSVLEFGDAQNRRASKPIFLTRIGDTSPMRFGNNEDGALCKVYPLNKTEFNNREDLAAEIGRSAAAKRITGTDPVLVGLLAICVIMVVPLAIIGGRLALS